MTTPPPAGVQRYLRMCVGTDCDEMNPDGDGDWVKYDDHAAARDEGRWGVMSRPVLDACCGSRMFWFDKGDNRAVFVDIRKERHELSDPSSAGGKRTLIIEPDMVGDFTALPFDEGRFHLVVFDPPHMARREGQGGWLAKTYGRLGDDWREDIRKGFAECFRVLSPNGTLVFKWNESDIPVSQVLALTPEKPLFGNRCGRTAKSHWIVFMKPTHAPEGRP